MTWQELMLKHARLKELDGRITVVDQLRNLYRNILYGRYRRRNLYDQRYHLIFSASTHKYKFNPCLSEEQIAEFEATHRIILPTDYRDFLKYVGNGGSGPDHGIMKLSEWDYLLYDEPDKHFLSTPFPHTVHWDENIEEHFEISMEDILVTGSMVICQFGCGTCYRLVVTGEEAGHIWFDGRGNGPGLRPLLSTTTGQKMTFMEWYDEWLTKSIRTLENH